MFAAVVTVFDLTVQWLVVFVKVSKRLIEIRVLKMLLNNTHTPSKNYIAKYAPFVGQFCSEKVMLSDSFFDFLDP